MGRLTERQIGALKWADAERPRHWGGKQSCSPPKATVLAMVRRGLMLRVGHPDMNLFQTTDAGRAALAEAAEAGGGHGP